MKLVQCCGCAGIAAAPTCCHRPEVGKYKDVGFAPLDFTVVKL